MTRRFIILLLCLLAATHCFGASPDLLRQQALCARLADNFNYSRLIAEAEKYKRMAEAADDKRGIAFSDFYLGIGMLYTNQGKAASACLNNAQRLAVELDNDSLRSLVQNSLGIYEIMHNNNLSLGQWHFTEALKYSGRSNFEKLRSSIFGNLCMAALISEDPTGINYARECYLNGVRRKDRRTQFVGCNYLGEMFVLTNQYDSAAYYSRKAIAIGEELNISDVAIAYTSLGYSMLHQGKLAEARKAADAAIKASARSANQIVPENVYELMAHICNAEGRYAESNDWLEKALQLDDFVEQRKATIYYIMARNYDELGDMDAAYKFMKMAKDAADSANSSDKERIRREREAQMNAIAQEKDLEMSRERLKQRTVTIALLAGLIVIIVTCFFTYAIYMRRRNRLYKSIVRQNIDGLERERRITQPALPSNSENTGSAGSAAAEKGDAIFRELCRLMEEERLFTDANLTRESVIERLGTNRTYFSEIVKRHTGGKNYAQFINQYRLREAIALLSDKTKTSYPIRQICEDSGFNNLTTFYKIFKDHTGISPSAYRKSLLRMGNDKDEDDDE